MKQWFYTVEVHRFPLEETLSSSFNWVSSIQPLYPDQKHRTLSASTNIFVCRGFITNLCCCTSQQQLLGLKKWLRIKRARYEQSNCWYPPSPDPAPHYHSAEHIFLCQQGTLRGLGKTQTHKWNLLGTSIQTPDLLSENLFVWGLIWGYLRKRPKS